MYILAIFEAHTWVKTLQFWIILVLKKLYYNVFLFKKKRPFCSTLSMSYSTLEGIYISGFPPGIFERGSEMGGGSGGSTSGKTKSDFLIFSTQNGLFQMK